MKKIMYYKFTIATAVLILVALLLPGSAFRYVPASFFEVDKLAHMALFFIFTLAFQFEFKAAHGRAPLFWRGSILIILFSAGSEALQLLTSTRSFDPKDMAADLIGASLAAIIAAIAHRIAASRRPKI